MTAWWSRLSNVARTALRGSSTAATASDLNGGLAALLGRWDDAVAHHERALAITTCRPRSPGHVRSDWRYGTTLMARGGTHDAERAAELLGDALATATATGMARLAGLAGESLGRMQQGAG